MEKVKKCIYLLCASFFQEYNLLFRQLLQNLFIFISLELFNFSYYLFYFCKYLIKQMFFIWVHQLHSRSWIGLLIFPSGSIYNTRSRSKQPRYNMHDVHIINVILPSHTRNIKLTSQLNLGILLFHLLKGRSPR